MLGRNGVHMIALLVMCSHTFFSLNVLSTAVDLTLMVLLEMWSGREILGLCVIHAMI